jgi:hypothetical protein
MKYFIICLILLSALSAQNIYQVSPNTFGNEITLTVANESQTTDAEQVNVKLIRHNDAVKFEQETKLLKLVSIGGEKDAKFVFDIMRNAPVNQRDTLKFLIKDQNNETWTKEIILEFMPPASFALEQNYPNPFNPVTTIQYQLAEDTDVLIQVYNIQGRKVKTLVNKHQQAGYYDFRFNASGLASGVYFYQLRTRSGYSKAKKLVIVK